MKKYMLMVFITLLTIFALGASCFALTMANTSKKGSLFICPLIKTGSTADVKDTIITISNDFYKDVSLECYYKKIPGSCTCPTFSFKITPNQPISWRFKTGKGVDGNPIPRISGSVPTGQLDFTGEMKCWAVKDRTDDTGNIYDPISMNYLSANAMIIEDNNESYEYSCWRFAVGSDVPNGAAVTHAQGGGGFGGTYQLPLTGKRNAYDACPSKLLFNFIDQTTDPTATSFPDDPSGVVPIKTVNNVVTLVSCKQDCVEPDTGQIYAGFARYNELEANAGGYTCVGCAGAFYSDNLYSNKIYPQGTENIFSSLKTPGGMFYVNSCPNPSLCQSHVGIPKIGVMTMQFTGINGPIAADTPTGIGAQGYMTNYPYCDDNLTLPVGIRISYPSP
jgi:hypothetical protein